MHRNKIFLELDNKIDSHKKIIDNMLEINNLLDGIMGDLTKEKETILSSKQTTLEENISSLLTLELNKSKQIFRL